VYTKLDQYEIMFHIASFLPFTKEEEQQVSRKRHLGNDIVVLIFLESECNLLFDPRMIHSYFNHVFFVIKKDYTESKAKGKTVYRTEVVARDGVLPFKPPLPETLTVAKDDTGKRYLLTKMINAERASYCAPGFSKAIERTKEQLLQQIFDDHGSIGSTSGWT